MRRRKILQWMLSISAIVVLLVGVSSWSKVLSAYYGWSLGRSSGKAAWQIAAKLERVSPERAEEWYIEKIEAAEWDDRQRAMTALGTMRSTKGVLPTMLARAMPSIGPPRSRIELYENAFNLQTTLGGMRAEGLRSLAKISEWRTKRGDGGMWFLGIIVGVEALRLGGPKLRSEVERLSEDPNDEEIVRAHAELFLELFDAPPQALPRGANQALFERI